MKEHALSLYRLGRWVSQIGREDTEGSEYTIDFIAEAMGLDPSIIYKAIKLYEWFPQEAEFDELLSRRGQGGISLGWGHLHQLLHFLDPQRREDLIGLVLRRSLTASQLNKEICRQEYAGRSQEHDCTFSSLRSRLSRCKNACTGS